MSETSTKLKQESKIRLCYIDPVSSTEFLPVLCEEFQCMKDSACEIDVISLRQGLPWDNLEYHSYEALVAADLIKAVYWAEQEAYDAAIIGCFYDPFLHAAREVCQSMVLTAPCQSSLQCASQISNKCSIIIGRDKWRHCISDNIQRYGYKHFVASLKNSNNRVSDYLTDQPSSLEKFISLAQQAIEQDCAESIILGCSANVGMYRELQEHIAVPVIDPALAALSQAKLAANNKQLFGWHTSNKHSLEAPWADPKAMDYFADAEQSVGGILAV